MSQKVANRKVITIRHDLSGSRTWDEKINTLCFDPDAVIVRQICYKKDGTETGVYSINTNLVDDKYLGTFIDGTSVTPNTTFTIKQLNGTHSFSIDEALNTASTTAAGKLVIILEFVKY
jgi:hypothetical protein